MKNHQIQAAFVITTACLLLGCRVVKAIECALVLDQLASSLDISKAGWNQARAHQKLDVLFDKYDVYGMSVPDRNMNELDDYFHIRLSNDFLDLPYSTQVKVQNSACIDLAAIPSWIRNDVWKMGYVVRLRGRKMDEIDPRNFRGKVIAGHSEFAAGTYYDGRAMEIGEGGEASIPHEFFHAWDHYGRFSKDPAFLAAFAADGGWKGDAYYNNPVEAFAEGAARHWNPIYSVSFKATQPALDEYFDRIMGRRQFKEPITLGDVNGAIELTDAEVGKLREKTFIRSSVFPNEYYDPETGQWYVAKPNVIRYDDPPDKVKLYRRLPSLMAPRLPPRGEPGPIIGLEFPKESRAPALKLPGRPRSRKGRRSSK